MIRDIGIALIAFIVGCVATSFYTKSSVTNAVVAKSSQAEIKRVDKKLAVNQKSGDSIEKKRRQIDTVFQTLDKEAAHDAPHVVDDCELPADRLRRWRAANAGTLDGLATVEHDASAAAAAATRERQDADAGSESSGRGESGTPASDAGLRAAALDRD